MLESSDKEPNAGDNDNLIEEVKVYRNGNSKSHQTPRNKNNEGTLDTIKHKSSKYYVPIQCSKSVYQSRSKDVWLTYNTIPVEGKL